MNRKKGILTQKFGLKIKLERTKRDLSQEQLAALANLNKNSVGTIERGESSPSLETIGSFAKALNLSILELLDFEKVNL